MGLTVKYSDDTETSYNLANESLPDKTKEELREVITELVKGKHGRITFGKTNYGKNHSINP